MNTDHTEAIEAGPEERHTLPLRPFQGLFCPGVCFTSGHCVCWYTWSTSPTDLDRYESVWIRNPAGAWTMYADPPSAGEYVNTYHRFDRIEGAAVTWSTKRRDRLEFELEGVDGTTMSLHATLGSTLGTRLVMGLNAVTPTRILRTSLGAWMSNTFFSLLTDSNGLKVAGITDRREPYRVEPTHLRTIVEATGTIDGQDLGERTAPEHRIGFGDAVVPNQPLVVFGDLFLRPPHESRRDGPGVESEKASSGRRQE